MHVSTINYLHEGLFEALHVLERGQAGTAHPTHLHQEVGHLNGLGLKGGRWCLGCPVDSDDPACQLSGGRGGALRRQLALALQA